jgi:hypothetical protein
MSTDIARRGGSARPFQPPAGHEAGVLQTLDSLMWATSLAELTGGNAHPVRRLRRGHRAERPRARRTLLPHLLEAADGLVVMDRDELLEDGALIGVPIADPAAAPVWPAYDRMWERIVTIVRRAGHPVLLLGPVPDPEELAPGGRWAAPVRCALLDCPDQVRLHRLRERGSPPEWRAYN